MTKKITWWINEIAFERHILDKNEFLNTEEAIETGKLHKKYSPERSSIISKSFKKNSLKSLLLYQKQ